ncbi:MAG: serine/threonine-protein kinase [Phycisphaerales bacterium]
MKVAGESMARVLERHYAAATVDPSFEEVLRTHAPDDEEDLACLIEFDGRLRADLGLPVTLERYLGAVPDLGAREVALDAAIDVTLRALCGRGRPDPGAVRSLAEAYPGLAGAIEEAAVLARTVTSTASLRERRDDGERLVLPSDFGPALAGGQARFELRGFLGKGASGDVYLANDRQLSEPGHPALVAVKIIRGGRTPQVRERLAEEASKARRVVHPNVARVLDRGVAASGEDYIVYEYIEGGDLERWLLVHPGASPRERALLMARVARAVHAAHLAGLVHCDLKPANILMTESGEPKVADFGIAVRHGEGLAGLRHLGRGPIGNMAFISPEQFRREEGAMSIPSDVYALGGLVYFALAGALPNGADPDEIGRRHRAGGAGCRSPIPGARGADAGDIDRVCARAMDPRPDHRHASASALADDLEAWARSEPIGWMHPGAARRARLWARRKPVVASLCLALAASVAAGGAAAAYWRGIAAERAAEAALKSARLSSAQREFERRTERWNGLGMHEINRDLLPMIAAIEAIGGDSVSGLGEGHPVIREERIAAVRAMLADAAGAGRADQVIPLVWNGALGIMLLDTGRAAEAERVLADCLPRFERVLGIDPLVHEVRLMHAAAVVHARAGDAGALAAARRVLTSASEFLRHNSVAEVVEEQIAGACAQVGVRCERPVRRSLFKPRG